MNKEIEDRIRHTRRLLMQAPLLGAGMKIGMGLGLGTLASLAGTASAQGIRGKGTPLRGGILQTSLTDPPPNFDPMSNTTGRVLSIVGPCCNGLLRYDEFEPEKIIPDLAESYALSEDGKVYTFVLRKGVKFHDGKPCTSADVKYTFDVVRNPPQGVISVRSNLLDAVDSIDTPDAYTVRFKLKRKSPSLIANLASSWMVVLPRHILEKGPMKDVIIGTGPFKFKEYKHGVSIDLVRNPDYHVAGKPYLDGVKFFIIPDENTTYNYFRTGQLDTWMPPPSVARAREKDLASRAYLQSGFSTSSLSLFFNAQMKPWDDVRVRQAACLAINREESMKTLYKGEGMQAGYAIPGPWALPKASVEKIPGYAPWREANLVKARALLAEAGFPNGFKETMLVRRVPLFEPHAIFMQDQLARIGIEVTLDIQETATYNETRRARRFKLDAGGRSFAINDPDAMFGDTVTCDAPLNFAKLCDPKIDDLFLRQSQETDAKKRLALVNELETLALNQYATYMLYFRSQFRFMQNNVHGWALHPNVDNATRMEDCWKSKA